MKKYVCYGGTVFSADGDVHFVSALKVARCYNVPVTECILVNNEGDLNKLRGWHKEDFICLVVRNDGDYPNLREENNV